MTVSYGQSDVYLFVTEEYADADDGIDTSNDVNATEQFSVDIDLRAYDGINIRCTFVEISGVSGTDNLLVPIYLRSDDDWDGDEVLIRTVECVNDGSEDIKPIIINARASGYGIYRLGNKAEGSTNPFDVLQVGRYWRIH